MDEKSSPKSDGHQPAIAARECVASRRPAGATDCHVHIFEPDRFAYAEDRSYTPAAATIAELTGFGRQLGTDRFVLVQPSVYGDDNRALLGGLKTLGPQAARGVAVIDPARVTDAQLEELRDAGVVGVRVNLHSKGADRAAAARAAVSATIDRVGPAGLAVQIYVDLALVEALADLIASSPTPVILDHFGGAKASGGVDQPGFATLLRLLEQGNTWVKLSGMYRASNAAPDFDDLKAIAQACIRANPNRLVWASDWPHTGGGADRKARSIDDIEPFRKIDDAHLLSLLDGWVSDAAIFNRILVDNPKHLFRF